MVHELQLRTLGAFELRDRNGRLITLPARRAETLFAFLALEADREHARRTLACLIWPDADPSVARASLRQAVHAIRKALESKGDTLVCDHHTLRLREDAVDVDALKLEAALRSGDLDGLREVRGRPLGDLLPDAPTVGADYEAWLAHRRATVADAVSRGLGALVQAEIGEGNWAAANATARAILGADPTCETGAEAMVRSLVGLKRRSEALRFAQRFAKVVRDEIGAAPSVDLVSLVQARNHEADDEKGDPPSDNALPQRPAVLILALVGAAADGSIRRAVLDAAVSRAEAHHGIVIDRTPNTVVALFGVAGLRPSDVTDALSAAAAVAAGDATVKTACAVISVNLTRSEAAPRHWISAADIARAEWLARIAGDGELRADDAVARMAGADRFAFEPCNEDGALVPVARGERYERTRFVGRKAECDQLRAAAAAVKQGSHARVAIVCGDPGAGKTRLLAEAAKGRKGFRSLTVTCRNRDTIGEGALLAELTATVASAMPPVGGLDRERRRRLRRASLARALTAAAADGPIAITIENTENAPADDIEELVEVIASTRANPLLWLFAVRREEATLAPLPVLMRSSGDVPFVLITLGHLSFSEAIELAEQFPLEPDARADCVSRADGNPLFLEQLLCHAGEGTAVRPPPSIRGALHGRLARLSPQARRGIEVLSVADRPLGPEALAECLEGDAAGVEDELAQRGLVARASSGLTLRHALIGEAVMGSMHEEDRLLLHRALAGWYERRDDVLCAEHLAKAGDAGAATAYLGASQSAHSKLDFAAAAALARCGLALARDADLRNLLALTAGRALADLGDPDDAIDTFREARAFAVDRRGRAEARVATAAAYRLKDACDLGHRELDAAAAEIAADNHDLLSELELCRGRLYFSQGRPSESAKAHDRAITHARAAGLCEREAEALSGLTDAAYANGAMTAALTVSQRCLELCRSAGLPRVEVAQLSVHVHIRIYLGEVEEALAQGQNTALTAQRLGHWRAEINALLGVASAAFLRNDIELCEETAEAVIDIAERTSALRFRIVALLYLARARLAADELDGTRQLLDEARDLSQQTSAANHGAQVCMLFACLADDLSEAQGWIAEGTDLLEAGAVAHNHLRLYPNAAWTLLRLGDREGALAQIDRLRQFADPKLPWAQIYVGIIEAQVNAIDIEDRLHRWGKVFQRIANAQTVDPADRVIA